MKKLELYKWNGEDLWEAWVDGALVTPGIRLPVELLDNLEALRRREILDNANHACDPPGELGSDGPYCLEDPKAAPAGKTPLEQND